MGTAVALAFLAAVLLLATLWTVDVGTGEELDPNFELGPLGPDRVVAQELTVRVSDMVGVQIAARAEGTLRPLLVQADLLAGDALIATRSLEVFPSTTLQLRRAGVRPSGAAWAGGGASPGPGRTSPEASSTAPPDRTGNPGGALRLDGRVEFADQDLALRVLHRRSLWTHVEALVGDQRAARAVAALTLVAVAAGLGLIVAATVRAWRPARADTRLSQP